jgi:tetratricopeptide (TPR) repeat protein
MEDRTDTVATDPIGNRRFAAFISYSHADTEVAAKLQRRLERYRLPKHVPRAQPGASNDLGPIFRDREDLAASASLGVAIRDAIQRAEALIVICSPDAAASRWVAAEIELFRELHPERPVLAALVAGEPANAFPPALTARGNEPLAADLRRHGDGPQLGFLKIVAGMAGVPLDALIQRDAQRRIRRVTAITVSALAAMLIMGIMTTFAIQARNEAARQRAAAEGLVEYMLTDLREILKGVGRPEAMLSVNNRALVHYNEQGEFNRLPTDSLEKRARVILAMGEDDHAFGRPEQAAAKFREAHRITEAILNRQPNSPDSIFAHAQSKFFVGLSALNDGRRDEAAKHWTAYRILAGRLANLEPNSVRSNMELGYSEGNLCELSFGDRNELSRAARHCASAIRYERAALVLAPQNSKVKQDLANRYGWAALVEMKRKNFNAAAAHRKDEAQLLDGLVRADPKNVEYALRRSWAQIGLADAYISMKKYELAEKLMKSSITEHQPVMVRGEGNILVMQTELRLWLSLMLAQQKQGKYHEHSFRQALGIRNRMNAQGGEFAISAKQIWKTFEVE